MATTNSCSRPRGEVAGGACAGCWHSRSAEFRLRGQSSHKRLRPPGASGRRLSENTPAGLRPSISNAIVFNVEGATRNEPPGTTHKRHMPGTGIVWVTASGSIDLQLAAAGRAIRVVARDQLGSSPPRRLQEAVKKRGEATGPSPVDRRKSGRAIQIASDARAMPLAVTVTRAGANDGCQTHKVLAAMVVRPPAPEVPTDTTDRRGKR
ncbi:hypothetical protein FTUN_6596 [Frigoriglobus tundricola]|uniref:Uncharacterized protein n=1 Tax=Frigoriglobus tundricola TaxID=2774151 RepID=A0A6M5Z018_9BACT|nr:hypothetical protein FTUN_6596 [Frigoriglobus tundricola]